VYDRVFIAMIVARRIHHQTISIGLLHPPDAAEGTGIAFGATAGRTVGTRARLGTVATIGVVSLTTAAENAPLAAS
jgi:hypothetical protein